MSEATIYNRKARYGSLKVSKAKRLRALEDENAKLKRLLAEAMPPKAVFGVAATEALGFEVGPENFTAGDNMLCFRVMRQRLYDRAQGRG